ncbi:SNRPN upstream reading frame protein-like [Balaenoptera ricei]|uniref:SNRPN upstream reading frame protein-like n=1 Tax=Balaenoptera ricei TaxID=2746895 RepID=UPI0028BE73C3|nr:SNRPN upstream reading frame protein-like [Balaenoptera ricei]
MCSLSRSDWMVLPWQEQRRVGRPLEMPDLFCSVLRPAVRWSGARDHLHLRWTAEQHIPEVEVQVKHRRIASLSNQECHLYPRRSRQQQQVSVVDFHAELRQAFSGEIPRGG